MNEVESITHLTPLQADLNSALSPRSALVKGGEEVSDIIPRMSVETSAKSLLVEEVGNKTDAATKDEETIEYTHLEVVFSFFTAECTTVAEQVDEADSNAAINVENEVVLLGSCHGLNSNCVIEKLVGSKVLDHELLDKLDTEIRVVPGLDSVANTGDFTS